MTDLEQQLAAEYHRGYEDGLAAKEPKQLSDDLRRRITVNRLRNLKLKKDVDSHSHLSDIASCIMVPKFGWTFGACERLRRLLIRLLDGEP